MLRRTAEVAVVQSESTQPFLQTQHFFSPHTRSSSRKVVSAAFSDDCGYLFSSKFIHFISLFLAHMMMMVIITMLNNYR